MTQTQKRIEEEAEKYALQPELLTYGMVSKSAYIAGATAEHEMAEETCISFLKWLDTNDYQFYRGGLINSHGETIPPERIYKKFAQTLK